MTRTLEFQVTPEEEGDRIDRILVRRVPSLGRREATALFGSGAVQVNGRRAIKAQQPAAGALVTATLPDATLALPQEGALDVLLERPDLVIVNKPAGQPTAVVRATDEGTLVNALLARYPEMATVGFGPREPGIIHRLDTQTSGVVIAARTQLAFEALRRALESGELIKRYLAIVAADAINDEGRIDDWLGPHRSSRKKVAVYPAGHAKARPAASEYQVVERGDVWALVEVTAPRAYRHQVRAHLAAHGCPIAGDLLYGGRDVGLAGRHALHASSVACAAAYLDAFQVSAPLPSDLAQLLHAGFHE